MQIVALRDEQSIALVSGEYRRIDESLRLGVSSGTFRNHHRILDWQKRLLRFAQFFELAQWWKLGDVLQPEMFEKELGCTVHDRTPRHLLTTDDAHQFPF